MVDYIEEMMRTAGVEKTYLPCSSCKDYGYLPQSHTKDCLLDKDFLLKEDYCTHIGYPDFTAEKREEIIKLISTSGYEVSIIFGPTFKEYYVGIMQPNVRTHFNCTNTDYIQALADFTTAMMEYEMLDKEKVKEILEG